MREREHKSQSLSRTEAATGLVKRFNVKSANFPRSHCQKFGGKKYKTAAVLVERISPKEEKENGILSTSASLAGLTREVHISKNISKNISKIDESLLGFRHQRENVNLRSS